MERTWTILIVEDDTLLANRIAACLEQHNYEVLPIAVSFERAVQIVTQKTPDFALIDIELRTEKDGLVLAHYLWQQWAIPFMCITKHNNNETQQRLRVTEPRLVLFKDPDDSIDELLEKLKANILGNLSISSYVPTSPKIKVCRIASYSLSANKKAEKLRCQEKEMGFEYRKIVRIETARKLFNRKNDTIIRTDDNMLSLSEKNLEEIEAALNLPSYFARIANGHIVNIYKIASRKGRRFIHIDGTALSIGRTFQRTVEHKIKLYVSHLAYNSKKG